MDTNAFILYIPVTKVYHGLIDFCADNGFTVKENTAKFHTVTAKKSSLLFWRNLLMEIEIMAVEKKKVEVNVTLLRFGKRKPELEKEYCIAMESFFNNSI